MIVLFFKFYRDVNFKLPKNFRLNVLRFLLLSSLPMRGLAGRSKF